MLNRITAWWNRIGKGWKWFAGTIVSIILYISISSFFEFVLKKRIFSWVGKLVTTLTNLFVMLITHWVILAFVVFAISILALHLKLHHLKKYVAMSFKDDFKKDLENNWDYHRGIWRPVPGGGVEVTQSEVGGITKVGHLWTDYSFEFTAVIVNRCIGWIVRAQDLYNYYMIQLDRVNVRPHLRFAGRWVRSGRVEDAASIITTPHGQSIHPDNTIEVRTEVRGSEIRVYVNNNQIYHNQTFFSARFIDQGFVLVQPQPGAIAVPPFTTGRVGFREFAEETGRFSWCRVRPL